MHTQDDDVTSEPARPGPLAGIRVVEMGQLIAGPFCGQLLGDLGADVIKLEDPSRGDPMREWGHQRPAGESMWWSVVARNKRSVTCDLRTPEGQDIARRLMLRADIVVENFRPGTLERWGLGYDELAKETPGLIMVRISGFGQSGPYASRAGYGAIGEAMGGLRYVVGDPSTAPSRVGISIGDSLAATYGALGALAALHERSETGLGQIVDSAIYEAVLAMMESLVPEYQQTGYVRERTGAVLPNVAPSNVYPTADGTWVLIAANQNTVFARLAAAMDRPELADDERFATHGARGERQAELDVLIAEWSRGVDIAELERLLEEHGVPCGRIYRAPEMLADEHYRARQSIVDVEHERLGRLAMQNVFPRLSRSPGRVRWPGPSLGAHTEDVLIDELGLTAERLAQLREIGAT